MRIFGPEDFGKAPVTQSGRLRGPWLFLAVMALAGAALYLIFG